MDIEPRPHQQLPFHVGKGKELQKVSEQKMSKSLARIQRWKNARKKQGRRWN